MASTQRKEFWNVITRGSHVYESNVLHCIPIKSVPINFSNLCISAALHSELKVDNDMQQ